LFALLAIPSVYACTPSASPEAQSPAIVVPEAGAPTSVTVIDAGAATAVVASAPPIASAAPTSSDGMVICPAIGCSSGVHVVVHLDVPPGDLIQGNARLDVCHTSDCSSATFAVPMRGLSAYTCVTQSGLGLTQYCYAEPEGAGSKVTLYMASAHAAAAGFPDGDRVSVHVAQGMRVLADYHGAVTYTPFSTSRECPLNCRNARLEIGRAR